MPFLEYDGAHLAYEIAGDPTAPAVVYLPGMGNHSLDTLSSTIMAALSPDYRILVPDHRGSGRTRVPPGAVSAPEQMTADVAAIMAAEGIAQAHIFGYSLGTALAVSLALCFPERVRSLALAAGFAHIPMPSRTTFILEAMRDLRASGVPRELVNRFNALYLLSENLFEHEDLIRKWASGEPGPHEQTPDGFTLQTDAFRGFDARARLKDIPQPALILSSPDDVLVPAHHQDELAHGLPNAQLKHYPGGHAFVGLPFLFAHVMDDLRAFWATL